MPEDDLDKKILEKLDKNDRRDYYFWSNIIKVLDDQEKKDLLEILNKNY